MFSLVAALAVSMVLAGCAQRDEGPDRTTTTTPQGTTTMMTTTAGNVTTTGTAPGGGNTIRLEGAQFTPMELTVDVGTTVSWVNDDTQAHDVTGDGRSWQSDGGDGGLQPGDAWSRTFNQAGTHDYYCTVHSSGPGSGMWAAVTVE